MFYCHFWTISGRNSYSFRLNKKQRLSYTRSDNRAGRRPPKNSSYLPSSKPPAR